MLLGAYRAMGNPKLGASLSRTFLGTIVLYTRSPKKDLTSCATCRDRLVRGSYIVSKTPPTLSAGLSSSRTMRMLCMSCVSPSSA